MSTNNSMQKSKKSEKSQVKENNVARGLGHTEPNFVIYYEREPLLKQDELKDCTTIYDIKLKIQDKLNMEVSAQTLCSDSILVPDTMSIEDVACRQSDRKTSGANRHRRKPTILTLKGTEGKCNLKINIVNQKGDTQTSSFLVHGTVSIFHLKQLIKKEIEVEGKDNHGAFMKFPSMSSTKKNLDMILSFNKKELTDSMFLFESLVEALSIRVDPDVARAEGSRNKREVTATLARAVQVDFYLQRYF